MAAVVCCLAGPLLAQEWHPGEPEKDGKDWVRTVSGEWIHGTIDLVRDLTMEFDSDDLDDLRLDWADIAAFRSPRVLTYVFINDRIVTGTGSMEDGVITITSPGGPTVEFPRNELLAIIEGEPREINYWSALATIGVTARAGNTDQQDAQTIIKIKRDAPKTRFDLGYTGNFGEVSGERTIDNHRLDGSANIFLSRKAFVSPFQFELYTDKFQNIDLRSTVGAGGGYYLFRQGNIDWSVGLSIAYQRNQFRSVEAGQDEVTSTASVVPSTYVEWDVTGDLELDIDYRSQIGVPDPKESIHHLMVLFSLDFYRDIFELTSSLTWDRVESPVANADGVTPKRDDFRFTFGFGVDL